MNIIQYIYGVKSRCRSVVASAARFAYAAGAACAVVAGAASCSNEGYDTGDGKYSYLTADLVLLHTNSAKNITALTLDDGTRLQFASPFVAEWAAVPDTVYRALLYYDKPASAAEAVTARGVSQVPVVGVVDASTVTDLKTDPLGIESVWVSKNGSFVNMSLLLKAGSVDDDTRQSIGLVCEGRSVDADGTRHIALRMYHNQNGMPEYYTVQRYMSVSIDALQADVVDLRVNTYDGEITKSIGLKR